MPKLFTPAVACPQCNYPNDESFRFCQQCGYQRPSFNNSVPQLGGRLTIDEELIVARREELRNQRDSSRYTKQKSTLEREFSQFLGSRASRKTLASAIPEDVIEFLIWKDHAGRTKVHKSECPALVCRGMTCSCPTRLAYGTVDSLIGKLRAIFSENGRVSEWHFPPWSRKPRCLSLG